MWPGRLARPAAAGTDADRPAEAPALPVSQPAHTTAKNARRIPFLDRSAMPRTPYVPRTDSLHGAFAPKSSATLQQYPLPGKQKASQIAPVRAFGTMRPYETLRRPRRADLRHRSMRIHREEPLSPLARHGALQRHRNRRRRSGQGPDHDFDRAWIRGVFRTDGNGVER